MITKVLNILRGLFSAAKERDIGAAFDHAEDAMELYNAMLGLADLDEETRALLLEGKDVLVAVVPILLSYAQGTAPTRTEKAYLMSQNAEFTMAFGKLIDTLPVRD